MILSIVALVALQAATPASRDTQAAALVTEARRLILEKKPATETGALLRKAAGLSPTNAEARYWLGVQAQEERRWADASDLFGKAIAAAPTSLWAVKAQKRREFVDAVRAALANPQQLAEASLALAGQAMEQRRYGDAEDNARKALALVPHYWKAELALALALASQGVMDEAIDTFRAAATDAPTERRAGIEALRDAATAERDYSSGFQKGLEKLQAGDNDGALALLQPLCKRFPARSEAALTTATILCLQGKPQEAQSLARPFSGSKDPAVASFARGILTQADQLTQLAALREVKPPTLPPSAELGKPNATELDAKIKASEEEEKRALEDADKREERIDTLRAEMQSLIQQYGNALQSVLQTENMMNSVAAQSNGSVGSEKIVAVARIAGLLANQNRKRKIEAAKKRMTEIIAELRKIGGLEGLTIPAGVGDKDR
ncbi:MAG: tetratricopeptide repeat protein [Armatimonas sp.]